MYKYIPIYPNKYSLKIRKKKFTKFIPSPKISQQAFLIPKKKKKNLLILDRFSTGIFKDIKKWAISSPPDSLILRRLQQSFEFLRKNRYRTFPRHFAFLNFFLNSS